MSDPHEPQVPGAARARESQAHLHNQYALAVERVVHAEAEAELWADVVGLRSHAEADGEVAEGRVDARL